MSDCAAERDPDGRRWAAALPARIAALCRLWGLEPEDATSSHGYHGVVLAVARGGVPCALKLAWPEGAVAGEATALQAWDGRGAVRLLEARPADGALLLERLDAGRDLHGLDPMAAATVAGRLMRRLAIPAPEGLAHLRETSAELTESLPARNERLGRPVPERWVDEACQTCRELGPGARDVLVHGDLHYGNVLAGTREPWLAIDPRPIAGDPEFGVAELLWTTAADPRRVLAALVDSGGLDPARARGWAVVRCIDYWLWGLENGLTEDPLRCRAVVEALAAASSA